MLHLHPQKSGPWVSMAVEPVVLALHQQYPRIFNIHITNYIFTAVIIFHFDFQYCLIGIWQCMPLPTHNSKNLYKKKSLPNWTLLAEKHQQLIFHLQMRSAWIWSKTRIMTLILHFIPLTLLVRFQVGFSVGVRYIRERAFNF